MRRIALAICCLAVLLPAEAIAQDPPVTAPPPAPPAQDPPAVELPPSNLIDFGGRGTSTSGDAARYERYRDLGDGLFVRAMRWSRETTRWVIDVGAEHVAREDQRFTGQFIRPGRLKISGMWDQIPMLMSNSARTLFVSDALGVLTIDDAIQSQVQASNPQLATLFDANASRLELDSRRHIASGNVEWIATPALTIRANVQRMGREGVIPFGGSFGHSSLVETPAPVHHSLVDVDAGAELSRGRFLFRGGYTSSFFRNEVTSLTFDNPFRLTNTTSASSLGRLSLPPSNSLFGVNGMASVSLPRRTRVTGYVSVSTLRNTDDTAILPHTVNPALPVIPLERQAVDGEARIVASNVNVVTRPWRRVDLSLRYRSYDYDNRTPEFHITQRVGFDNAVSTLAAPKATEPHSLLRHLLDADARFALPGGMNAGIGYSRVSEDRTHRIFESITDDTVRATFDLPSGSFFTLRTTVEHSQKRGHGDPVEIAAELAAVNEQPGMRHFDIASRDRDRVSVLASVTPFANLMFTGSVAAGSDDYLQSEFGLRDNTHRVYSVGVDATPGERVTLGGSYAFERYHALSRSRQANPGAQFTDPSRNWATDATDRVHSFLFDAGVQEIGGKVDLHLGFDYNRSRGIYNYITGAVVDRTLPEEVILPTTLPPPTQLPPTTSDLTRGTLDVTYALTRRLGVGVSYWYEDYAVTDFTLDAQANPELARGQVLLIGYLYEPYTAHTVSARLVFRW